MAIECVDRVLKEVGPPVYVFHEIVHNKHVVDDFKSRGVTFVDDVSEVPEGGVVVYSAHGISPEVRRTSENRRLIEVDATCPLVTKVHMEVLRYASNRGLDDEIIRFIANQRHWVRLYGIKVALVNNPKCPLPVSMRFLAHLNVRDLKTLSRSKGIPSALSTAAKQLFVFHQSSA